MFINFLHWVNDLPWHQINWELIGSVYLDGVIGSMISGQIFANPIARLFYPDQTKADDGDRFTLAASSVFWPIMIFGISYKLLKKVKLW